MRHIKFLLFLLPLLFHSKALYGQDLGRELFICYGKIDPALVAGYGLVILESQHYSANEILEFKKNNLKVVGYLSLAEVHSSSDFFQTLEPYTSGENKNWNSNYIHLNDPKARDILLQVVSSKMEMGIDGLFLDNLDNVSPWGPRPEDKAGLIDLVKKIRQQHPSILLVQNAGLFLIKDLRKFTDSVLVESVFTDYDFGANKYAVRKKEDARSRANEIARLRSKWKIPFYIVEYARSQTMKDNAVKELETLDCPYFIANIDLQTTPIFN